MSNFHPRIAVSRFMMVLTLRAQRSSWLLPPVVRGVARRILVRILPTSKNQNLVEDWSEPLIEHRAIATDAPIFERPIINEGLVDSRCLAIKRLPEEQRSAGESSGDLRCLIVTRTLDAGGIDEFVAFLARQLPAWEFHITVMCASSHEGRAHKGGLAAALENEGISVIDVTPDEGRRVLETIRPDVISAHDPPDWVLEAARDLRVPVVETLHGVPTPIGTDWRKELSRSENITSMVAVSDFVRQLYLRGNPKFANDAIVTIPNAFNTEYRPMVDRAKARTWLGLEDEFLFVSLGRHAIQKNTYGLVTAFSDVARAFQRAHLVIAGRLADRLYTEQVCQLRDDLPERNRIHLRDNLSDPSVLLAAADGFVLNSFFEGWPLASMEALSAGLPVVMTEVGGAREQVGTDGERGYIVLNPLGDAAAVTWESASRERFRPHLNRTALVAAMTSVIKDREYWVSVRSTLAQESKRRFSPRTCAEQHARVLRCASAHCTLSGRRVEANIH
jgi:glycosyltransferase involved in cell wall biosynthesis